MMISALHGNVHRFQLLELNIVSAQDLSPVSKSMRTYAIVWIHPERKLTTKVDNRNGHTNPQWNDKFVFRVDDSFLNSETSAVTVEIFAAAWLKDVLIGSVRVPIIQLFPSTSPNNNGASPNGSSKTRFLTLQVRRPSGRPQGILNMGYQLLDGSTRSMPLYTELSASGVEPLDTILGSSNSGTGNSKLRIEEKTAKLRRTRSDKTDLTLADGNDKTVGATKGSLVDSSLVNVGDRKLHEGHANRDKDNIGSQVNGSLCNSDVGPSASVVAAAIAQGLIKTPANNAPQTGDGGSSILDDWTEENDSVEGLRTKLERWRAELPPAYDADQQKTLTKQKKRQQRHQRRRGGNGSESSGLFSCFGNAFGCQIAITCGGGGSGSGRSKRGHKKKKVYHQSSVDSQSYM